MLTLPAGDGFRDTTSVGITATSGAAVDVLATLGARTVTVARGVRLVKARSGYAASVRIHAASLRAGSWRIRARRSDRRGVAVAASRLLPVGSGVVRSVTVTPHASVYFPREDGFRDRAVLTVTARDETGASLPARGDVRLTAGRTTRSARMTAGGAQTVSIPVTGLPHGTASVVARVTGPAGRARSSRLVRLPLQATGLIRVTLTPSGSIVEPVASGGTSTGLTLALSATTTTGTALPTRGSVTITGPLVSTGSSTSTARTVLTRAVTTSRTQRFSWDGRVGGLIEPGTYRLTARLGGPEGGSRAASTTVTVTDHRVRTLFDLPVDTGNQQGLAVRGGTVYVTVDEGADASGQEQTRIDEFDRATGARTGTIGPLALGHGAEISVAETDDGRLYVANGGPEAPTEVFVLDANHGTVADTFDLASLGPNGMVAVDDASDRLLVYSGTPGHYEVTPISLDGAVLGPSVPVVDEGTPQGIEVVHGEWWVYTSIPGGDRIARFDPGTGELIGTIELALHGEGEGLAVDPADGDVLVGVHSPDRVGLVEPVPGE